ncbi:MAG: hypothetical protein LBF16_12510, partial [Pseudomonadales bacterium]|nr:hypothetical protein [Pseudomonadales bacterium]
GNKRAQQNSSGKCNAFHVKFPHLFGRFNVKVWRLRTKALSCVMLFHFGLQGLRPWFQRAGLPGSPALELPFGHPLRLPGRQYGVA